MPPPARAVPEEVVEEILLRLPPHKPKYLVRASLVSKNWLALLSGARFTARYRRFHKSPPMLGFLKSRPWNCWPPEDPSPPFVSTTKGFRARVPDDDASWGHKQNYGVWDCRHGRVLLGEKRAAPMKIVVWDPITGRRTELREPGRMVVEHTDGLHAMAVLCAVSTGGCDHRACSDGPSRVVFFSLHNVPGPDRFVAQACVFSSSPSEVHGGEWSKPCRGLPIDTVGFIEPNHLVLVNDAIHFMLVYQHGFSLVHGIIGSLQILKYDLSSDRLSIIYAPAEAICAVGKSILMAMADGNLGFAARTERLTLCIWSTQVGYHGAPVWARSRVIRLNHIPPFNDPLKNVMLLGSMEGNDVIFLHTEAGVYKLNLKMRRRKKIWEGEHFNALIPYASFYNPLLRKGESL